MKIRQLNLLQFAWALLLPLAGLAQTGPGGVGNATGANSQIANTVWLDAASLTGLSSGAKVSSWTDRSGNSRPAIQATTANQPTYMTNVIGGQPAIRFDRSSAAQYLQITASGIGAMMSGNHSIYLVAKANAGSNASNRQGLFLAPSPNTGLSFENASNTRLVHEQFGSSGGYYQQKNNISANTLGAYIMGHFVTSSATSGSLANSINGAYSGELAMNQTALPLPDLVWLGRADADWYLQGDIAEAIGFSAVLTPTQRIIVENYLSAKYGIGISNDYYSTHEASYKLSVQGIGSANGTSKHSSASSGQGLGLVELNNSLNAANEYVFAGHNATSNGLTTTDSPSYYNRWQRSWYIQKTGAVDSRLTFDFSQAGLSAPSDLAGTLSSYKLFYRSGATGSFSPVSGVSATLQGSTGIGFDLTSAQLLSGYYTLGIVATPSFTWSPSAATTDWNTASNWTEGIVPISSGDVIVNACTVCPQLAGNTTVKSLTLNSGAALALASYALTTSGQTLMNNALVTSASGHLIGADISSTQSTFTGNITLQTTDNTSSQFQGINTFNGTLVLNLTNSFNINSPTGQKTLFNQDVIINLLAGNQAYQVGHFYVYGAHFKKKLTLNNMSAQGNFQAVNVLCDGRFQINASGDVSQSIGIDGKCTFKAPVAIAVATNTTPDISFSYNDTYPDSLIVFSDSIIVSKPSGSYCGIHFTGCQLDSTALVKVNSFYYGYLLFNKCVFASKSTPLTITMPSDSYGLSLVSSVFDRESLISSPNLLWVSNQFNFNTQINITPLSPSASWGTNLYTGGNLYRKKITINNQTANTNINMGQFLSDKVSTQ